LLLSACGFHLQRGAVLAAPLQRLYVQSPDPYGILSRALVQYLKMSKVQLTSYAATADTVLVILQDRSSQTLLSVSGTTQTRQYNLKITVVFELRNASGQTLVPPQTLTEERAMTVQQNQILGSSNEASLYYQQMRRSIAYAILNRLASGDISKALMPSSHKKSSPSL
jgi:LPS-assembly lipoprotein